MAHFNVNAGKYEGYNSDERNCKYASENYATFEEALKDYLDNGPWHWDEIVYTNDKGESFVFAPVKEKGE